MGHAMMVDHRTLDWKGDGLASTLARAGFHVLSFDAHGHGKSGPRPEAGGDWRYDDILGRDWPAVIAAARERHPGLPVAGLGHSLCAHAGLAGLGLGRLELDAFVGLGANTWLRSFARGWGDWCVKRATLEAFRALSAFYGRFPVRTLGMGTDDVSRSYVVQSTNWARKGRWTSEDGTVDYHPTLAQIGVPVLAVHGAADHRLSSPESSRRFHAPVPRVEHMDVSRDRFGYDADHMTLVTRHEGRAAWEAIGRWLQERLPPA